jgi:molybdopterin-guanine dinucleotide biosynthesis protein A
MGLVLCGGESSRMGRDKGLLCKDGIPWAQFVGQRLFGCSQVFYSIHPRQLEAYAAVLPAKRLITDAANCQGPLNGLLSAHYLMPGPDILLAACDMLDMDRPTLEPLVAAWQVHDASKADFFAYGDGRLWQPFGAIYTSRGLKKAEGYTSLQSLLRSGRTQGLPVADPRAFNNYNTL